MMESVASIKKKLKSLKPRLQQEYNVNDIGVFGSYATGTHRIDSDIDLMVSFSGSIGWKFFNLKTYLEQELGLKVDLVTKDSLKKRLRDQILNQVIFI